MYLTNIADHSHYIVILCLSNSFYLFKQNSFNLLLFNLKKVSCFSKETSDIFPFTAYSLLQLYPMPSIIFLKNSLDIRVCLPHVFHNGQPFCTIKIERLTVQLI